MLDSLCKIEISLLQELSKQVKAMKHLNLLKSCDAFEGLFKVHNRGTDFYLRHWHNASWLE